MTTSRSPAQIAARERAATRLPVRRGPPVRQTRGRIVPPAR